jgi:dienelactone hydrolase
MNKPLRDIVQNWNNSGKFEVKIHPAKSDVIVLNLPGISGDIDGFMNKYQRLSDIIVNEGIGAVVRSGNQEVSQYPHGMIQNFRNMVEYTLENAFDITGTETPSLYLMGFSAGASVVAAVAHEFSEVEKILLMAPAGDAGELLIEGLPRFTGEVYAVVGDHDRVVGPQAADLFCAHASQASKKESVIIPYCDHQFKGEKNGKVLSLAPLWAFGDNDTFPSPEGGTILYR